MTSINPKTAVWWNLAFLILTGIAAGTVDFARTGARNRVHHQVMGIERGLDRFLC